MAIQSLTFLTLALPGFLTLAIRDPVYGGCMHSPAWPRERAANEGARSAPDPSSGYVYSPAWTRDTERAANAGARSTPTPSSGCMHRAWPHLVSADQCLLAPLLSRLLLSRHHAVA